MTTSPEALRDAVERVASSVAAAKWPNLKGCDVYPEDLTLVLSALQEAREARVPEGWALVPIEPTEAMISAGANGARNGARETAARTYASMLSAAPAQPPGAEP